MIQIYLTRHAQSQWQVRPDDDWDSVLTDVGRAQAHRMGEWLAARRPIDRDGHVAIARLLSSRLRRARETADCVARSLDLPVKVAPCLDEAAFRVSEHLPQLPKPFAEGATYVASAEYAAFRRQARDALGTLVDEAVDAGGAVLAVTHSGLVKTLIRVACGSDAFSCRLYNASLTLLEWSSGRWHLVHLNLWDHLPPDLRTR